MGPNIEFTTESDVTESSDEMTTVGLLGDCDGLEVGETRCSVVAVGSGVDRFEFSVSDEAVTCSVAVARFSGVASSDDADSDSRSPANSGTAVFTASELVDEAVATAVVAAFNSVGLTGDCSAFETVQAATTRMNPAIPKTLAIPRLIVQHYDPSSDIECGFLLRFTHHVRLCSGGKSAFNGKRYASDERR